MGGDNGTAPGPGELPATRIEVGIDGTGPGHLVIITEVTPQSTHALRLPPDVARALARSIDQAAARVTAGLVLPASPG